LLLNDISLCVQVKSYFNFSMKCGCGIPWIELRGTVEDWASVREKAARLAVFDLEVLLIVCLYGLLTGCVKGSCVLLIRPGLDAMSANYFFDCAVGRVNI
jgi:hypothetical protein